LDSSLITVLANLGTGGVVIILVVLGYLVPKPAHTRVLEESARKDEVIEHLQAALTLERQQANDVAAAGTVTNQLISGLVKLAGDHRAAEAREHQDAADRADARALQQGMVPLDITGKDLGL
jgi:hypothetical protein